MAGKKKSITLIASSTGSGLYAVKEVRNLMKPKPGDSLTKQEAESYVNSRDVEVKIVKA